MNIREFISLSMIRFLYLGICQAREDSSLQKVEICFIVSIGASFARGDYYARLLLNVAHLILAWFLAMKFSDCMSRGLRSIPLRPITGRMNFFHAAPETNIQPLPVYLYFNLNSLWLFLCFCRHKMLIFYSIADTVCRGSWFIVLQL